MSQHEYTHIIEIMAGLGMLFFGYTFMYVRTRLDNFREDLFDLRDELFDYMVRNDLPFSMPAYGLLRDTLNGTIRFARKTWLFGLWFTSFLSRGEGVLVSSDLNTPLDEIEKIPDPEIRSYYRNIYHQLGSRIFDYIFLEGPLWPIAKPIKIYLRKRGVAEAQRRMGFHVMAEEAAHLGKQDSEEAKRLLCHGT